MVWCGQGFFGIQGHSVRAEAEITVLLRLRFWLHGLVCLTDFLLQDYSIRAEYRDGSLA